MGRKGIPVEVYTIFGKYVGTYQSQKQAARQLRVSQSDISDCLCRRRPAAGGIYKVYFAGQESADE